MTLSRERKWIVRLFQDGQTVAEIALLFGVTSGAIQYQLAQAGLGGNGDALHPHIVEQFDRGFTIEQIAQQFEIQPRSVKWHLTESANELFRDGTTTRRDALIQRFAAGSTISEIAAELEISLQSVRWHLRVAGCDVTRGNKASRKSGPPSQWEERREEIADLIRQGNTLQQIGEKYGVTRERVRQVLKRLGLSILNRKRVPPKLNRGNGRRLTKHHAINKSCSVCKETKLLEAFTLLRTTADGKLRYSSRCKQCSSRIAGERMYSQRWKLQNPEKAKEIQRAASLRWQQRNSEKIKERRRAYLKRKWEINPELKQESLRKLRMWVEANRKSKGP